jgi:hypothetical protein
MQHKIIILFLFVLIGVSICCTSILLLYQHVLNEVAVEKSEKTDASSLSCIELSNSKYSSLTFTSLSNNVKEVNMEGVLMDVYKIEHHNHTVKLYVIIDNDDTDAETLLIKTTNHTTKDKQTAKLICLLFPYFAEKSIYTYKETATNFSLSIYLSNFYSSPFIAVGTQPPNTI